MTYIIAVVALYFVYCLISGMLPQIEEEINYAKKEIYITNKDRILMWKRLLERKGNENPKYQTWSVNIEYNNFLGEELFFLYLQIRDERRNRLDETKNTKISITDIASGEQLNFSEHSFEEDGCRYVTTILRRDAYNKACSTKSLRITFTHFGIFGNEFHEVDSANTSALHSYLQDFHRIIEKKKSKIETIVGNDFIYT